MPVQRAVTEHVAPLLVTEKQAAELLSVSQRTLQDWRITGANGLRFVKLGSAIRYDVRELERWIAARTVASTSQQVAP